MKGYKNVNWNTDPSNKNWSQTENFKYRRFLKH